MEEVTILDDKYLVHEDKEVIKKNMIHYPSLYPHFLKFHIYVFMKLCLRNYSIRNFEYSKCKDI